tara:strand:- start:9019 stop:9831 length:813 start_codon:yes stop_codon:yes gene_type:complete
MPIGLGAGLAISAAGSIGGSLLGGLIGGGDKPEVPAFVPIDPAKEQRDTIQDNTDSLAAIEKLGREVNLANVRNQRAAFEAGMPGQFDQASSNIAALLRGEIPTDVGQQIARTSAAAGFRGGFQGSKLGGNLTARDLGLTSLGLQQTGLQNFGALANLINPNPFNVSSMFFSPGQRVTIAQNERNQKFNRDMAAAGVAAAPSPMQAALGRGINQFGQTIGQIGAFAAGQALKGGQTYAPGTNTVGQAGSGFAGPPQPAFQVVPFGSFSGQ